jgi:thioredoxin reductase
MKSFYDVIVIGAGPAGLAAALASAGAGAKTLLVEREANLGGILKQCIHDGFGLVRYGEKLSGPEYAHRFISQLPDSGVEIAVHSFVSRIEKRHEGFELVIINKNGVSKTECKSIVFACGCRERTSRQIGIHGRHSAGIFTAGTAQYYTNILGKMPAKRCVILGSGDIGLIMARRLKLEGAEVIGVYEAKSTASGLMRNVYQCLEDFDIPLHTSKTVTRVFGDGRLNAVEISSVDDNMIPVPGTEQIIECDALILSVGLIPENELAESLKVPLDGKTKGPVTDQNYMTMVNGVFCCGNALHVNDLVDYVSESGEAAGRAAAQYISAQSNVSFGRSFVEINADDSLLYIVPQRLSINELDDSVIVYFRSSKEMDKTQLIVTLDGKEIFRKTYPRLRPPEMERLELDFNAYCRAGGLSMKGGQTIKFSLSPDCREAE